MTAGWMAWLLASWTLGAVAAPEPVDLIIRGGTI